jgi:hypothetical protein
MVSSFQCFQLEFCRHLSPQWSYIPHPRNIARRRQIMMLSLTVQLPLSFCSLGFKYWPQEVLHEILVIFP